MREPVGECHPLAVIAYSENRPRWHNERRQAKVNVRPRSSPRSQTSHVVVLTFHPGNRARTGKPNATHWKRRRQHCELSVNLPL